WFGANAAIAVGFLPWLPAFIDQQSHALNTSPRTATGLALDTLTAYGGGIVHGDVFLATGGVLVALAVLGTVLWRDRRPASLGLLIWLVPLVLVVSLGLRSGLFELRYLVLSLPGLVILAAAGIVRLARHPIAAVGVGLVALAPAALGLSAQYFDPTLARDDYR